MRSRNIIITLLGLVCTAGLFAQDAVILSNPTVSEGITQGEIIDWSCYEGFQPFEPGMDPADTLWWTGILDQHIFGGQSISWNPDLPVINNVILKIKYGLWNSPSVLFTVTLNGSNIGSFWANWGYISPGPKYVRMNISNYIIAGPDRIVISAAAGGGEAVIGYVGAATMAVDASAGGIIESPLQETECKLHEPAPNPFNPVTSISFSLKKTSNVNLTVFNIAGGEVFNYQKENESPGDYTLTWDASKLASGMYIVSFQAGGFKSIKKAVLLK